MYTLQGKKPIKLNKYSYSYQLLCVLSRFKTCPLRKFLLSRKDSTKEKLHFREHHGDGIIRSHTKLKGFGQIT